MFILLGGKFESAMIRAVDQHNRPDRNTSTHPYYVGLNRKSPRSYFDRAATLMTLANETVVAGADWSDQPDSSDGILPDQLAIRHDSSVHGEWDPDARDFAAKVIESGILPPRLRGYISHFELDEHDAESAAYIRSNEQMFSDSLAEHYLCRLIFQIRRAQGTRLILALDEQDIEILAVIAQAIESGVITAAFAMPDIPANVIDANKFGGAVLTITPPDARALIAIRQDAKTSYYASRIRSILREHDEEAVERELLVEMGKAYRASERFRKADRYFEISGWVAKPINYIPVIGTFSSMAGDAKDTLQKAMEKRAEADHWYLLAARANQVGIEDYLARKGNMVG